MILDWDDILVGSTWITNELAHNPKRQPNKLQKQGLQHQETEACLFITALLKLNLLITIVTNANQLWLDYTSNMHPRLKKLLSQNRIKFVSARELWSEHYHQSWKWKSLTFDKVISDLNDEAMLSNTPLINRLVSIGDSLDERKALYDMKLKYQLVSTSSVKLFTRPNLGQVCTQIAVLREQLKAICLCWYGCDDTMMMMEKWWNDHMEMCGNTSNINTSGSGNNGVLLSSQYSQSPLPLSQPLLSLHSSSLPLSPLHSVHLDLCMSYSHLVDNDIINDNSDDSDDGMYIGYVSGSNDNNTINTITNTTIATTSTTNSSSINDENDENNPATITDTTTSGGNDDNNGDDENDLIIKPMRLGFNHHQDIVEILIDECKQYCSSSGSSGSSGGSGESEESQIEVVSGVVVYL